MKLNIKFICRSFYVRVNNQFMGCCGPKYEKHKFCESVILRTHVFILDYSEYVFVWPKYLQPIKCLFLYNKSFMLKKLHFKNFNFHYC